MHWFDCLIKALELAPNTILISNQSFPHIALTATVFIYPFKTYTNITSISYFFFPKYSYPNKATLKTLKHKPNRPIMITSHDQNIIYIKKYYYVFIWIAVNVDTFVPLIFSFKSFVSMVLSNFLCHCFGACLNTTT